MKKAFIFFALLVLTAPNAFAISAAQQQVNSQLVDSMDRVVIGGGGGGGGGTTTVVNTTTGSTGTTTGTTKDITLCDKMSCPSGMFCSDGCCSFVQKKTEQCPAGYTPGMVCAAGYTTQRSGTANGLPCVKCVAQAEKCMYNNNQPCPTGYFCSGIAKMCCPNGSDPVAGSCNRLTITDPIRDPVPVDCSCEPGYSDMTGKSCPAGQTKMPGRSCVDGPQCARCVATSSSGGGGGGGGGSGNLKYFQNSRNFEPML